MVLGDVQPRLWTRGDVLSAGPRISPGGRLHQTDPLMLVAVATSCERTRPTAGGSSSTVQRHLLSLVTFWFHD